MLNSLKAFGRNISNLGSKEGRAIPRILETHVQQSAGRDESTKRNAIIGGMKSAGYKYVGTNARDEELTSSYVPE